MTAIKVNGVEIPRAAIEREAQHHPSGSADAAYQAAVQALVVRELLLQRAHECELVAHPQLDASGRRETDEDALVRALLERELAVPTADESSCRRYYANNPSKFRAAAGDLMPFEAVHARLAAYLEAASWQRAAGQYVQLLVGQAQISGIDIAGTQSPLVQ